MNKNNYPNGKLATIYKIFCNDLNIKDIYIGATINFPRRIYRHKLNTTSIKSKEHNFKIYKFIRDNGGWDNWGVSILKECVVNNRKELHKIERLYVDSLKSSLNTLSPYKSELETQIYHKEYSQRYRMINRDKVKLQKKLCYQAHKESISLKGKSNKIFCFCCNREYRTDCIIQHNKTKKHLNNQLLLSEKSKVVIPVLLSGDT